MVNQVKDEDALYMGWVSSPFPMSMYVDAIRDSDYEFINHLYEEYGEEFVRAEVEKFTQYVISNLNDEDAEDDTEF